MDLQSRAAQPQRRSAGVINDHQAGLAVALGNAREWLHRYPWAPKVVMAAAEVVSAARQLRQGRHTRAAVTAFGAGYHAAQAVRALQDRRRADLLRDTGVDDEASWRGHRRPLPPDEVARIASKLDPNRLGINELD
jgi:hypothetical protein